MIWNSPRHWGSALFLGWVLAIGEVGAEPLQPEITSDPTRQEIVGSSTTSVEKRLTDVEARIAAIDDNYRYIQILLQIFLVAGSLVGAVVVFLGISERLRSEKHASELTQRFDKHAEEGRRTTQWYEQLATRQEERSNQLIEATQGNIQEASQLFGALTSMLELQKKANEIKGELDELKRTTEVQARIREAVVGEINRDAIHICWDTTRANYVSIERQERFHEFSGRLGSRRQEFGLADDELNATCYLVLGLDLRLRDIEQRISHLTKAVELGKRDLSGESRESLHPGMPTDEFREWSRARTNDALYHLAILYYNLGDYTPAVVKFEEARGYSEDDIASMLYIPEAKFLGHLVEDFDQIVREFESVAALIRDREPTRNWSQQQKDALLSQLYVKLGNCYYANSPYEPYAAHRSLNRAFQNYELAYNLCNTSYLAQFSYAQALASRARQKDTTTAQQGKLSGLAESLFHKVFPSVSDKLAMTVEAKIRMMLYYILAICVKEGQIEGEIPQAYITQIHVEKGNLGANPRIRIFSPRTKNDLTPSDFVAEVQEYQRRL